ncbi:MULTISPECIES: hypothetical protein [Amycolatopsis]|uniref:MFS transporter n=1 Tax=Amycolatopsis albidoflavus TaxID=102226 RepID=A0ABW5I6R5_9PSEU
MNAPALRDSPAIRPTTAAAVAALGTVASVLIGTPEPLSPFVASVTPTGWSGGVVLAQIVPMIGILVAVFTIRWWPWTLLAGTVLAIPRTLAPLLPDGLGAHPSIGVIARVGAPMVLIAVLGAAQELYQRGARKTGLSLTGLALGCQIFAAALTGVRWLSLPLGGDFWRVALGVLGIVGAVLAVVGQRFRRNDSAWPEPTAPGPRLAVAAVCAVLLPMLVSLVDDSLVSRTLGVSPSSLARHPGVVPTIAGLGVLVLAVAITAVAGTRVFFGVATMALVQLGVAGPLLLALYATVADPILSWIAAAAGVAAGCWAAATRWRAQFAVSAGVLAALVLCVLSFATDGKPEKIIDHQASAAGALLLAVLAATAAVMVATAAPITVPGALPASFGPITSTVVLGGGAALVAARLHEEDSSTGELAPAHHLGLNATLLFLAALLVAGFAGLQVLRAARQPAAPSEVGPSAEGA